MIVGRWCPEFDHVYEIDSTGNLVLRDTPASPDSISEVDGVANFHSTQSSENENEKPTKEAKVAAVPKNNDAANIKDRTVYQKYFGSIGAANILIFLAFGIAFGFCIKFPGMLNITVSGG